MFKLIDIVGFRDTARSFVFIEKYRNLSDNSFHFILALRSDMYGDDDYYFNNNVSSISRIFNTLKNNGSSVITKYSTKQMILIGKNIKVIKSDAVISQLFLYEVDPFSRGDIDLNDMMATQKTLRQIFTYLSYLPEVDMNMFD
jgi:hypothetical protein